MIRGDHHMEEIMTLYVPPPLKAEFNPIIDTIGLDLQDIMIPFDATAPLLLKDAAGILAVIDAADKPAALRTEQDFEILRDLARSTHLVQQPGWSNGHAGRFNVKISAIAIRQFLASFGVTDIDGLTDARVADLRRWFQAVHPCHAMIDPNAPKLPEDYQKLKRRNIRGVLMGATEIWSTEQDNDSEFWYFTPAGQYVRICGIEQEDCYVYDREEAYLTIGDILEDLEDNAAIYRFFGPYPGAPENRPVPHLDGLPTPEG